MPRCVMRDLRPDDQNMEQTWECGGGDVGNRVIQELITQCFARDSNCGIMESQARICPILLILVWFTAVWQMNDTHFLDEWKHCTMTQTFLTMQNNNPSEGGMTSKSERDISRFSPQVSILDLSLCASLRGLPRLTSRRSESGIDLHLAREMLSAAASDWLILITWPEPWPLIGCSADIRLLHHPRGLWARPLSV